MSKSDGPFGVLARALVRAAGRRVSRGGSLGEVGLPAEVAGEAEHNANNQLRNWDGAALSYDVHGALTGDGSAGYEWDARGRLTRIRQGEVEVAAYGYDALNRRIWRRAGGRTRGYLYDGWNVVQELNAAQANAGRTNYAANVINGLELDERYVRIVAPHSGNAAQPDNASNPSATQPMVTALVGDALGSTQLVLRADQQVQARYVYEPYGRVQQSTPVGQPASDNPYQYTGREYEGASVAGNSATAPLGQLYHYRHRYYSAALHRFVSEDPIEFAGGSSSYGYVGGDPLDLTDPFGLVPPPICRGSDCSRPPYDPTPDGSKPSPQPKPGEPDPRNKGKCSKAMEELYGGCTCAHISKSLGACLECCGTLYGQRQSGVGSVCSEQCYNKAGITSLSSQMVCSASGNQGAGL